MQLSSSRVVERAGGQDSEPSGHAEARGSQEGDAGEQHRGGVAPRAAHEKDSKGSTGSAVSRSASSLLFVDYKVD